MIPVRLNLRNFMCYTDVHQPLDFEGIHVACLTGQNGHGKSALLDAITWALWGKSRARTADELISQAPGRLEMDMEVEFEFQLGEQRFRVIRKRSKRGRGQSMLELALRDGSEYRPLTGNNLAETERQIQQLLRMSYETFTNSSFILQGKADSFTTRTPGERKQILAEILDLSYYDQLEDRARQLAAQRTERQAVLTQQIRDDDAELQSQPELRERHEQLVVELATAEEALALAEAQAEARRERLARLQAAERELEVEERRLREARERAERQRGLVASAEAALQRASRVVERAAEIEAGHTELQSWRRELERLGVVQAEYARLKQEEARLGQAIAQARGELDGRRQQLTTQLASTASETERATQLEVELAEALAEGARLDLLEQGRSALERDLLAAREQYSTLKADERQHLARHKEIRQRRALLGDSASCPVCQTTLPPERQQAVLAQYAFDEREAERLARETASRREQLEQAGVTVKAKLGGLDEQLGRRGTVRERVSRAERELERLREQGRGREVLEDYLRQVVQQIETTGYAPNERAELALAQQQIGSLGYEPETYQRASAAVADRAHFESLMAELVEARREVVRQREAGDEAQRALGEWVAQANQAELKWAELQAETRDLPAVRAEAAAGEDLLREQRFRQGRLHQELGALRQRLNTMEFTARRRDERRAELERVMLERSTYLELTQAFGKRGLQAMLIETAIPELEDEANWLLGLMTGGRMHVIFETQRPARSADTTIETLDIRITDELGIRAYEMFSGGEAFRVNFAIRIALSRLLARRAGTSLQTLVIDEGFGSQDDEGRDRLVEAIKAIQDEFKMILVITHLPELKDLFPVRIEVTRTPAGSLVEVS